MAIFRSVREKSLPMNEMTAPVLLAAVYDMQSARLSAAGCPPALAETREGLASHASHLVGERHDRDLRRRYQGIEIDPDTFRRPVQARSKNHAGFQPHMGCRDALPCRLDGTGKLRRIILGRQDGNDGRGVDEDEGGFTP